MSKLEAITEQFIKAVDRLTAVLDIPKTDVVRDSAIQRFEFTLDLGWKALKAFLEEKKGIVCNSPKECFREAYRQGIIEYDEAWLKLVEMRNETVHTYKEEVADKLYAELPDALAHFKKLLEAVRS